MGDIILLGQLVSSMEDAVKKLEQAINKNKIEDFNKIKTFILDNQKKIKEELQND
ncbi:MAG: hypothetical protein Q7S33_00910 [Nanoarchaeota archaeon]|nr:hypothetical protein [Nanoarchaeota archaeon]